MPGWFQKSGSSADDAQKNDNADSTSPFAQAFREGLGDHLKARAELLAIESREAGEVVARKGLLALLVAGALVFAYALLLVAAVAFLGHWIAGWSETLAPFGWPLAAVTLGFLHLITGLILYKKLKSRPGEVLFEYTRAEIHKDRAWLDKGKTSGKESDSSH